MAVKDLLHRSAVYFGLAEDRYEDEYFEDEPARATTRTVDREAEMEDRYRERPNVRRLQSRRRRDEIDDIFGDDDAGRGATQTLRSVGGTSSRSNGGRNDVRVHFVAPKSFNDAQDVADKFKETIPVILNLQGVDADLSKRLIDFASGLTYALDGGMQRIAEKTFMLTPRNVEVSAEEKARLLEKGFFNQS
ncbi:MAG: cell division inhibitor SepF [Solirubrobacteraceae bacterium]|jgi:cell division inhibitor SepF|nr:cell division inhibitor SepF [Solirubrobacteraceae bacterium]